MSDNKQLGQRGEDLAGQYLENNGYKILSRNWRNKWGEIDIVAKKGKRFVFCEVKTIKKQKGFLPEDEIDQKKKYQLRKMAQIYLSANKLPLNTPHQIDIIAIEIEPESGAEQIRHIENVIEDIY